MNPRIIPQTSTSGRPAVNQRAEEILRQRPPGAQTVVVQNGRARRSGAATATATASAPEASGTPTAAGPAGIDAVVALAPLTTGGTAGSLTVVSGVITAYTAPT